MYLSILSLHSSSRSCLRTQSIALSVPLLSCHLVLLLCSLLYVSPLTRKAGTGSAWLPVCLLVEGAQQVFAEWMREQSYLFVTALFTQCCLVSTLIYLCSYSPSDLLNLPKHTNVIIWAQPRSAAGCGSRTPLDSETGTIIKTRTVVRPSLYCSCCFQLFC